MNNVLTKVIALCAVAVFAAAGFAQNAGPRQGGPGGQGGRGGDMRMMWGQRGQELQSRVLDKIGATSAQKNQIKALGEKMMKERREFMQKEKIPMPQPGQRGQGGQGGARPQLSDAQRDKMMQFARKQMETSNAEMKRILGDKYEAYQKEMRAEMQKMMQERGRGDKKGGDKKGAGAKPPRG
jgi:Spy/CpxP family protein refolding chaperone